MRQLFLFCSISCLLLLCKNSFGTNSQRIVAFKVSSNQPGITSPKNNSNISTPLTIEGTGTPGRKVEINVTAEFENGEQDLGTFTSTASSSGKWSTTPIQLWLPEDAKNPKYVITAIDALEGKKTTSGTVTVFPPKNVAIMARKDVLALQPQKSLLQAVKTDPSLFENIFAAAPPAITSPASNEQVSSPVTIKGTAAENAPVQVSVKAKFTGGEQDLGMFRTKANTAGKWETTPINLFVPEDAKNTSFVIAAVQFDENDSRSRTGTVTVKPKSNIMLLHTGKPVMAIAQKPATIHRRVVPDIKIPKAAATTAPAETPKPPAANVPVTKPMIITPQNNEFIDGSSVQFFGKGTAGNTVKLIVDLKYLELGSRKSKRYQFSSTVDANEIWSTQKTRFSVPANAYDIKYQVSAHQTSPDGKNSGAVSMTLKQQVSQPEIKSLTYFHPSSTASRDVMVSLGVLDRQKDKVTVTGTGGRGLKVKCELQITKNGKKSGHRYGEVIVDSKGKWKWETGWLAGSPAKYKLTVVAVQMSPGVNDDKSEPVSKTYNSN